MNRHTSTIMSVKTTHKRTVCARACEQINFSVYMWVEKSLVVLA